MRWKCWKIKRRVDARWRRWLRPQLDPSLMKDFPNMNKRNHRIVSPYTDTYNCWAHALGMDDRWCSPDRSAKSVWPLGIRYENTVEAWILVFELYDYTPCNSPQFEKGIEKVAIYVNLAGVPTHAARQTPNGQWTSKIGDCEGIMHKDLRTLEGNYYGTAMHILCRATNNKEHVRTSEVQWLSENLQSQTEASTARQILDYYDTVMEAIFQEKRR